MAKQKEHETVGWLFKSGGAVYRCTRYKREGFDMVMVSGADALFPSRKPGYITNVSERAIGRTFHRNYDDIHERPSEHVRPCICYICERR